MQTAFTPAQLVHADQTQSPRQSQLWRVWLNRGLAGLSLVPAVTAAAIGLRGTHVAVRAYHVDVARLHGLLGWDSGWYWGNYPVSDNVLYPMTAAVLGLAGASVFAVMSPWCFDRAVRRLAGRPPARELNLAVSTQLVLTIETAVAGGR